VREIDWIEVVWPRELKQLPSTPVFPLSCISIPQRDRQMREREIGSHLFFF
jgi:hypothetical protein